MMGGAAGCTSDGEETPEHQNNADAEDHKLAGRRNKKEKGRSRDVHPTTPHCAHHRATTKIGQVHIRQGKGNTKREDEQTHAQAEKQPTTRPTYHS